MRSRTWKAGVAVIAGFLAAGTFLGWAQYAGRQGPIVRQNGSDDSLGTNRAWDAKRLNALNADRHKSMVSDTVKLVKLARQLDAEVASNPTDQLTPEELRKVEAIEKLARNVKTKMAQSFGGGPEIRPLVIPPRGPGED